MVKRLHTALFVFVLAGALLSLTAPSFAADEGKDNWYETFNGHDMWMMSLDDGMALAKKEGKPMLIDLFSPG